jgi:hypothetical protein
MAATARQLSAQASQHFRAQGADARLNSRLRQQEVGRRAAQVGAIHHQAEMRRSTWSPPMRRQCVIAVSMQVL